MIKYALIVPQTGEIYQTGSVPDEETLHIQGSGEDLEVRRLPEGFMPQTNIHWWNGESFAEYPPRPNDRVIWDGQEWLDPRSSSEIADELNQVRANTHLDKSDLLIRLALAEIISEEEADEAAGGVIPASMQPMLQTLPPEAQMAARIKWKADTVISRNHPVIVAAAYAMGITDEQLDEIFDVA